MLRRKTIWPFVLLIFVACTPVTSPEIPDVLENRTFVHLFFSTEEECLEAQPEPDFFLNCHQEVNFLENNEVEIMLTDVFWRGKYAIRENQVLLSFEPNYEIPNGEIIFEMLGKGKLLRPDNNTYWKEVQGNDIWE